MRCAVTGASRFIAALGGANPKLAIRNPKRCYRLRVWAKDSGRSANFAATLPAAPSGQPSGLRLGHNSDFGFPSDFGFRVSDFAPPRQLQEIEMRPQPCRDRLGVAASWRSAANFAGFPRQPCRRECGALPRRRYGKRAHPRLVLRAVAEEGVVGKGRFSHVLFRDAGNSAPTGLLCKALGRVAETCQPPTAPNPSETHSPPGRTPGL